MNMISPFNQSNLTHSLRVFTSTETHYSRDFTSTAENGAAKNATQTSLALSKTPLKLLNTKHFSGGIQKEGYERNCHQTGIWKHFMFAGFC